MEQIDNYKLWDFLTVDMYQEMVDLKMTGLQKSEKSKKNNLDAKQFVGQIFSGRGYVVEINDNQVSIALQGVIKYIFHDTKKTEMIGASLSINFANSFKEKLLIINKNDVVDFSGEILSLWKHDRFHDEDIYGFRNRGLHCMNLELISIEKYQPQINKNTGCFIATAVYDDYNSPEVQILRLYRDEKLLKTSYGKIFVMFYYSVSPFIAAQISKSVWLKKSVKQYFLDPIVTKLKCSRISK